MYQLFVFFMITDPRTVVKGRRRQIVVAALIALVETLPLDGRPGRADADGIQRGSRAARARDRRAAGEVARPAARARARTGYSWYPFLSRNLPAFA